ncbi:hypothetical protein EJB05_34933 [Eragrostis curvula]|uniref:Uncharacterized protein n=1 Tax=Eragrostis curvula TaxID=38414 RepID=A0A5J9U580_9POAL|nr:hypothetical protein EJB05_34933 [Eragrostis curvula]
MVMKDMLRGQDFAAKLQVLLRDSPKAGLLVDQILDTFARAIDAAKAMAAEEGSEVQSEVTCAGGGGGKRKAAAAAGGGGGRVSRRRTQQSSANTDGALLRGPGSGLPPLKLEGGLDQEEVLSSLTPAGNPVATPPGQDQGDVTSGLHFFGGGVDDVGFPMDDDTFDLEDIFCY